MTRRSAERWNTGKRWAAISQVERFGEFYARRKWRLYEKQFGGRVGFSKMTCDANAYFSRSPNLRWAFRRGAWKWVESQPVEF